MRLAVVFAGFSFQSDRAWIEFFKTSGNDSYQDASVDVGQTISPKTRPQIQKNAKLCFQSLGVKIRMLI